MKRIAKILCAVDPTEKAQPALIRAAWIAECFDAELHLMISYYNDFLVADRLFDGDSLSNVRTEILQGHKLQLEELAEPLREKGISVVTHSVWDHPLSDSIVRQAVDIGADIVFKDTHRHSRLSVALFTHTDWELIRTCPSPLWLVNPVDIQSQPVVLAAVDPLNDHDKPGTLDDQLLTISTLIANEVRGELHSVHTYDPRIALASMTATAYAPLSLPLDKVEEQVRERHQEGFEKLISKHGIPDSQAHLVAGLAHEQIPELVDELQADLVVIGAVSRNRLQRLLIGSTAERTLGQIPCDLLVVKPEWFESPVASASVGQAA